MVILFRVLLMAACRWVSEVVPCATYRTEAQWVDHFGASVAVHSDDNALYENDQDILAEMRATGRYQLIKRARRPENCAGRWCF